jgi:hypothetical protein
MLFAIASIVLILLSYGVFLLLAKFKDMENETTVLIGAFLVEILLSLFVVIRTVPVDAYVNAKYSDLLSIVKVSKYSDLENIIDNVGYLKYRYELMWNNKSLLINGEKCSKDYYVNAVLNKFYGTGSENYEYSFDNEYDALVDNLKK